MENIVQAISRDILCSAMRKMEAAELPIVLHVHDEAVAEVPAREADSALKTMLGIMAEPISWAPGLPLKGAGFVAPYYQKRLTMHDGELMIATAQSARAKTWKNAKTTWSKLVGKLTTAYHTHETMDEYKAMSKDDQSRIKDVGGFVGGYLKGR